MFNGDIGHISEQKPTNSRKNNTNKTPNIQPQNNKIKVSLEAASVVRGRFKKTANYLSSSIVKPIDAVSYKVVSYFVEEI